MLGMDTTIPLTDPGDHLVELICVTVLFLEIDLALVNFLLSFLHLGFVGLDLDKLKELALHGHEFFVVANLDDFSLVKHKS